MLSLMQISSICLWILDLIVEILFSSFPSIFIFYTCHPSVILTYMHQSCRLYLKCIKWMNECPTFIYIDDQRSDDGPWGKIDLSHNLWHHFPSLAISFLTLKTCDHTIQTISVRQFLSATSQLSYFPWAAFVVLLTLVV